MDIEFYKHAIMEILKGVPDTFLVVLISLVLGFFLSFLFAVIRYFRIFFLKNCLELYGILFRGTPLFLQIYLIYHAFPTIESIKDTFLWVFFQDAFNCIVLAFTLNTVAYSTEIFYGSFLGVPKGEIEAASVLGFNKKQTVMRILIPRALGRSLVSYSNELIILFKSSALLGAVGMTGIMGFAEIIISQSYRNFEIYFLTALVYFVIVLFLVLILRLVEKYFFSYQS